MKSLAGAVAHELGYDLDNDVPKIGLLMPWLVELDAINGRLAHTRDGLGADYYVSKIDYGPSPEQVVASRMFTTIMRECRTLLSYVPHNADPRTFSMLQGTGWLVIGKQPNVEANSLEQSQYFLVDAANTPEMTVQPGDFYTFIATSSELTMTSLTEIDAEGNWPLPDVTVTPGTESIYDAGRGLVLLPDDFFEGQFD